MFSTAASNACTLVPCKLQAASWAAWCCPSNCHASCITAFSTLPQPWHREQVQTEVMGDIHHYAWRARHRNQTLYINRRDGERFGNWTHHQCAVRPFENWV